MLSFTFNTKDDTLGRFMLITDVVGVTLAQLHANYKTDTAFTCNPLQNVLVTMVGLVKDKAIFDRNNEVARHNFGVTSTPSEEDQKASELLKQFRINSQFNQCSQEAIAEVKATASSLDNYYFIGPPIPTNFLCP